MDKKCFDIQQGRKFEASLTYSNCIVAFNFKNMNIIFHSPMRLILVLGERGGESSKTLKRGEGAKKN